ncbi:MAG: sigma-54-dependent Fis family transcriptional regulator [Verrucomicrobia bacterium]|nr:sigma-54-dependent Fis family transcriptional regulator [Verrucomicrobiota bacterium]MBI3867076.1 sigma-54-dependent Fis family transcriptional regulator [Verrucomicrobiota bacterium]
MDDDVSFATVVGGVVREGGGLVTLAHTIAAAREHVAAKNFDLVLLDNHLPDGKGYDLFETISRRNPDAPVVMITGVPDLGEAVALTRNGLFEYLTKPVSADALAAMLARAKLRLNSRAVPESAAECFGGSSAMGNVLRQLGQASRHAASTVLLTGETGTGKDLAARVLHELSFPNGDKPFIAVNCAALPDEMFESELFGAERGAFTGADRKRAGLVRAAANGSLFLDEIAEVPLALQSKLLRLIEAREFRALGSTEAQSFNGRFIAATNKNLADAVKAGAFREDLLYRFDVFNIELLPLRRRRADIPRIAETLLGQLAKRYGRAKPLITPEEMAKLSAHDFPGNVRELRNILERSLLKTSEDAKWLTLDANWSGRGAGSGGSGPGSGTASALKMSDEPPPAERNLTPVETQEYRLIRDTLRECNGGIRRAATKLGMSPQALLRRLEKWPELRVEKE